MEAPKRILNRVQLSLEELPLDVHLHILNFLPFKDSVRSLFRVSKTMSEIVRDALSKGKKNSLDCLISGVEQSGTTTLFWLLSQDKKAFLSNLNDSQEQPAKPELPLKKEGMQYIKRINIEEGRTAVIFHGSNKPTRRKQMFPYYGLTQCLLIVVPAQVPQEEAELTAFKNTIKELILPAYALCGHMNWIFAINKMDLMEYTEKAFNDVSAIALEICSRVSNHIQAKISFIPISALNSLNIFKDTKYSNESPLSWFKGPSLVEKLNQISMSIQTPVYKFFRRPSFVVISTKELTVKRKQKKKHPNDPYKIIIGYVTDGFFDNTEKLYMLPNVYRHAGCKYDFSPRWAFNIETIKSFDTLQNSATAGNFLGVGIHLDTEAEIIEPHNANKQNRYQRNIVKEWYDSFKNVHRGEILDLKPHYNRLSTTKDVARVISAEAQVVMLGSRSVGKGTWNGELKQNFSAGFYAQGVKTLVRIGNVIEVQDKNGRVLQDVHTAVKGQKATVRLVFRFPICLPVYNKKFASDSYPNSDGRFLLYIESRVIGVGVISKVVDYDPKTAPRTYCVRKEYMW